MKLSLNKARESIKIPNYFEYDNEKVFKTQKKNTIAFIVNGFLDQSVRRLKYLANFAVINDGASCYVKSRYNKGNLLRAFQILPYNLIQIEIFKKMDITEIPSYIRTRWDDFTDDLRPIAISIFSNEKQCNIRTRSNVDGFLNIEKNKLYIKFTLKSDPIEKENLISFLKKNTKTQPSLHKLNFLYELIEGFNQRNLNR